jgi:hypothetical protein
MVSEPPEVAWAKAGRLMAPAVSAKAQADVNSPTGRRIIITPQNYRFSFVDLSCEQAIADLARPGRRKANAICPNHAIDCTKIQPDSFEIDCYTEKMHFGPVRPG